MSTARKRAARMGGFFLQRTGEKRRRPLRGFFCPLSFRELAKLRKKWGRKYHPKCLLRPKGARRSCAACSVAPSAPSSLKSNQGGKHRLPPAPWSGRLLRPLCAPLRCTAQGCAPKNACAFFSALACARPCAAACVSLFCGRKRPTTDGAIRGAS